MPSKTLHIGKPNPKQDLFLRDLHKVVIFGGARGGGKSWSIRTKSSLLALNWAGIRIMIVRKTYPELTENHIRPMKAMLKCGAPQGEIAKYKDATKEMTFPNGSIILYRYCDNDKDLDRFQGLEVDILFIDEATQFTEYQIKTLMACVRGVNGFPKRIYLTCNPSGQGMGYVKRIAIDRNFEEGEDPDDYIFIQSLVTDNEALMRENPDYIKQLESLPPKLREAWLNGRWDVFEGAYFEEFRGSPDALLCHDAGITVEDARRQHRWTHVIEPFDIPIGWNIYRSYDFGFGKPFSVGWWAVDYDDTAYRILELYGCTKTPNEGVKWTPAQQMDKIAEIEREHPYLKGRKIRGVADPAIWEGSHGISIVEEADKRGVWFEKGINDRIAGWMQVRERLKFDEHGYAKMYFFNTCKAIIRTMPLMMYDEHKPEDLDSDLEDHACDECRYFAMMRPIAPRLIQATYKPHVDPLDQFTRR